MAASPRAAARVAMKSSIGRRFRLLTGPSERTPLRMEALLLGERHRRDSVELRSDWRFRARAMKWLSRAGLQRALGRAGSRCWISTNAMPESEGSFARTARTASSPPAEAPIATMGTDDASGSADVAVGREPDSDLPSTRESSLGWVRALSKNSTICFGLLIYHPGDPLQARLRL